MHVDNCSATMQWHPIQRWMWGVFAFGIAAVIALAVAFAPFPAAAGLKETVAEFMSTVLAAIVSVVGKLLLLAIYVLTLVAQYNGFMDAAAVTNGWVIVRDVGNMFFIVVLLIIAFATILNVSSYQWKAMLPQLIIAAILINFSKTIAGIFIDVSQVIMLTFVNGFAAAAGGNFANMFRIQDLLSLDPNAPVGGLNLLAILGSYILAFIMLTIALVTTLIMAVILAFRIVMLWVLVVLSPLPYVLNLLPQGKKYGERWWSMFGEYLTVGPVLAFFLWLALVSVGSGTIGETFTGGGGAGTSASEIAATRGVTGALPTGAADPRSLISFVIGICMLIGGLKITGEMGVIGASAATGAVNKFGSMAKGAAKKFTGYRYAEGLYKLREKRKEEEFAGRLAKVSGGIGLVTGTVKGGWTAARGAVTGIDRQFSKRLGLSGQTVGETARAKFGGWRERKRQEIEKRREERAKRITAGTASFMDNVQQDAMVGWQKHGAERSALNVAQDQRVEQRMKAMQAQGLSKEQLTASFESAVSTDDDKLAAAVLLAMREGFREGDAGRAQVAKAKTLMGGNAPFAKRFGDELDKRLAHLNIDPGKKEDVDKFIVKIDKGEVDFRKLRHDAGADPKLLRALSDRYSPVVFRGIMEDFAKRTKRHKDVLGSGLAEGFKGQDIAPDGKLDSLRSAYATVSGDLVGAVRRDDPKDAAEEPDWAELRRMVRGAKADLVAKIDLDTIPSGSRAEQEITQNISIGALKGLARTGEMRHLDRFAAGAYDRTDATGAPDYEFQRKMWKDDVLGEIVRGAGRVAPPYRGRGGAAGGGGGGGGAAGGGGAGPAGGAGPP